MPIPFSDDEVDVHPEVGARPATYFDGTPSTAGKGSHLVARGAIQARKPSQGTAGRRRPHPPRIWRLLRPSHPWRGARVCCRLATGNKERYTVGGLNEYERGL